MNKNPYIYYINIIIILKRFIVYVRDFASKRRNACRNAEGKKRTIKTKLTLGWIK